jgi:GGDEF domain-containing protein
MAARGTRVVVVGRTALAGVNAVLRRQRDIELVRASTPIVAIGEVAAPIEPAGEMDLTVIVSPEALAAQRAAAFASAIHRVDERARLLCLGEQSLEGFEPPLGHRPDAALLLARVRGSHNGAAAGAQAAPPRVSPAVALATGRDPVAAALEDLRERWNLSSAVVTTEPAGAAIVFNGREVGRLVTDPALPAEVAAREAEAIGPWLVLARQQEQLRQAALTDELTGAYNRRYFNRFLAAAIASAAEKRHTVSLLVFDVDNFKSYNDRFGHSAGDEILVESVRLLNTCIRATDRVCRIGGDEFAVIFHDPAGPRGPGGVPTGGSGPTSPQSIGDIVRRIQCAICGHRFPKLAELAPGTLTISGGMATFPWDGRTVQQLLDRADSLALQSKREGKNKITFGPGAAEACGV